ncbi:MAG: hypothetical protein AB7K36_28135 [Chloroflexota bacterium]
MAGRVWWVGGSRALPAGGAAVVGQLAAALSSAPGASAIVGSPAGPRGGVGSACAAWVSAWPGPSLTVVSPSFAGRGSLAARAAVAVRQAASSGAAGAVAVISSPASAGSLAELALAARLGVPLVVAVAVGFSGPPSPLAGRAGSWAPARLAGVACWRWAPAASQPPLL